MVPVIALIKMLKNGMKILNLLRVLMFISHEKTRYDLAIEAATTDEREKVFA